LVRLLPVQYRVDGPELMLVIQRIEEVQQRRKRVLQRRVEY